MSDEKVINELKERIEILKYENVELKNKIKEIEEIVIDHINCNWLHKRDN